MEEFLGLWAHWISACYRTWHLTVSGVRFPGMKLKHTQCGAHLYRWGSSSARAGNPTPERDWEGETCWLGCHWHRCAKPQAGRAVLPGVGNESTQCLHLGFPRKLRSWQIFATWVTNEYKAKWGNCWQRGRGQGGGSQGWGISGERYGQSWGGLRENQESRKLLQTWYRMAAPVNREVSCAGPVWEPACIQMGIYQERNVREAASACILLSPQPHYQALTTLKSKHRFKRIKHHPRSWYRLRP